MAAPWIRHGEWIGWFGGPRNRNAPWDAPKSPHGCASARALVAARHLEGRNHTIIIDLCSLSVTVQEWNIPIKAPWTYEHIPHFFALIAMMIQLIYKTNPMFLWVKLCKTKTKWQRHSLAGLWQPSQQASAGLNEAPFISHLQVNMLVHDIHCACSFKISIWLVVSTPLKNMGSSDWIIIPAIGEKNIHVPNHQSVYQTAKPH